MGCRKEHKIENNIEKKHCPTCNSWKELNDFTKQSSSWDNLCRMCRNCFNQYKQNKRKTDLNYQQKELEYKKNYQLSGRKKEMSDKRYSENKEEIIKKQMVYNKKRYHEDMEYKMKTALRNRMNKCLKIKDIKKCNSTIELIGCTPNFVKEYLKKKFTEEMSWQNHGTFWHIDHIIPISAFDLNNEKEQIACFHYTNLQPLSVTDNLVKSNKYNEEEKKAFLNKF